MIFLITGTQAPFDRLVKCMDEIAPSLNGVEIIAQINQSKYKVKNMKSVAMLNPIDFNENFSRADLIVSHAGMGTIISALQNNKPVIILPRSAALGEHRNEHQLATAKILEKLKYIHVIYEEKELEAKIFSFLKGELIPLHAIENSASSSLIGSIQEYLNISTTNDTHKPQSAPEMN
ncbi:glycosyltransferase [Pedobacter sp. CAN_A7]|uniref:glycosyltransferase n=1 Tax=Pedobacter sp. CAN_A7 TaxID=2787722 RepID=UPI0018CB39C8